MTEFYDFELNSLLLSGLCRISWVVILLLSTLWANSQEPIRSPIKSNLRQKVISNISDSITLDTLSIIPRSLSIEGVDSTDYRLDFVKGLLVWTKRPAVDSLIITYRVFPFRLDPVAQRMSYDSVVNNFYVKPFEFNTEATTQKGIFDFGTMKAEGSFGRQIGFGNNQDAVLNSTLNLQLSGMLGDSIEVQAAITDNNIPIQPDGNTQQLNEFDQVFLQFKKEELAA